MSLTTAGFHCTVNQRLSGAMEDCSVVQVQQPRTLCHHRCCMYSLIVLMFRYALTWMSVLVETDRISDVHMATAPKLPLKWGLAWFQFQPIWFLPRFCAMAAISAPWFRLPRLTLASLVGDSLIVSHNYTVCQLAPLLIILSSHLVVKCFTAYYSLLSVITKYGWVISPVTNYTSPNYQHLALLLPRGHVKCSTTTAKAALSSTVSTMKCPASDFIPELTMHYREVWQAEWDGCSANKLHSVKPVEDQLAFFTLFLKGAAIDWYDTLMATQKQSVCIVDVLQTWSEFKTNNIVHNQDSVQQFL